jgi:hypothetical protein
VAVELGGGHLGGLRDPPAPSQGSCKVVNGVDHAGLSSRAEADQLGHANTSMSTDVYFGRKVAPTCAAAVLEALEP